MPSGMDSLGALILQAGLAGPLMLALIVQTAARRHQGRVQQYLLWLLGLTLAWMIGMVVQASGDPALDAWATALLLPPSCFMSPLFLLMILAYARIDVERHPGARLAVLAPFCVFFVGFLTNPWHGLMADARQTVMQLTATHVGPLFWAFEIWSNANAFLALGVCAWLSWSGPTPTERRRATLLWSAALIPLIVHALYTYRVLPLDFALTPSALGVTALLVVAAVRRYRLLDIQPVARRDVIEASSDAVILADVDERVVDLNPRAAVMLGGDRAALCGRALESVLGSIAPIAPPDALGALLDSLRAGQAPPAVELETADGSILELTAGCPRTASGEKAGIFVVLRDRSKERRSERLLQQSQRLESVAILAGGVAHEVNNPLSYVRANLAHLREVVSAVKSCADGLPDGLSARTQDLPDVIEESIVGLERIQEVVQGLLRLSRTTSQRIEDCDVNAIVAEATRFASLDGSTWVRVESRLADGLPSIEASPDQLVQVLLNLFLNAKQALGEQRNATIVVSTAGREERVEVRIEDNGPGVPEAIRHQIFDPFFTTRAPNEGTGLGLAIALDIVGEHGGTLLLETSELGGACFIVRLPRRRPAVTPPA